ncbi:hypothetical protein G6F50_014868 [Rhizopus delemar]|uniref:Uncharacterized protein n=1 Tax=Rhizopus delemar TaxID=936053 RepID=A0A9P6Y1W4_9FUNG|nr:hypothetical protein G6F50_014868 [Rhizopus delemar]
MACASAASNAFQSGPAAFRQRRMRASAQARLTAVGREAFKRCSAGSSCCSACMPSAACTSRAASTTPQAAAIPIAGAPRTVSAWMAEATSSLSWQTTCSTTNGSLRWSSSCRASPGHARQRWSLPGSVHQEFGAAAAVHPDPVAVPAPGAALLARRVGQLLGDGSPHRDAGAAEAALLRLRFAGQPARH